MLPRFPVVLLAASCMASAALALTSAGSADPDYITSIETWRAGRISRLTAPTGWLALIGRHPLERGTWTVGSGADNTIRLAAGPDYLGEITHTDDGKVLFTVGHDVDATIDGVKRTEATDFPIGGTASGYEGAWSTGELDYKSDQPTYVRAGTVNFYILEAGGKLFVRVRDSESDRRKNFAGIESYPINPVWRIEASWVPFDPPRTLRITNVAGITENARGPGKAVFQHDGRTYALIPMQDNPADPLFFVLTDTTAGTETYEASRFLYADPPKDGKVILDFNKVYNPPCAFTPFTVCPLPPKENVLPFPLRAGEKKYPEPH